MSEEREESEKHTKNIFLWRSEGEKKFVLGITQITQTTWKYENSNSRAGPHL